MKNKTKTYILLALVIGIWGVLGYQIVSTINPETPEIVAQDIDVSFNPKHQQKKDTFSVQTVDRDPFLGILHKPEVNRSKQNTKSDFVWQPIIYHGSISKQNDKSKIFVVSINGQQYLLKIGQKINDIILVSGNTKTIVVGYKNHRKTISKT